MCLVIKIQNLKMETNCKEASLGYQCNSSQWIIIIIIIPSTNTSLLEEEEFPYYKAKGVILWNVWLKRNNSF